MEEKTYEKPSEKLPEKPTLNVGAVLMMSFIQKIIQEFGPCEVSIAQFPGQATFSNGGMCHWIVYSVTKNENKFVKFAASFIIEDRLGDVICDKIIEHDELMRLLNSPFQLDWQSVQDSFRVNPQLLESESQVTLQFGVNRYRLPKKVAGTRLASSAFPASAYPPPPKA